MTTISQIKQAPPLDEDYDYYGAEGPTQTKAGTTSTTMSQQPRVRKASGAVRPRKGLGAIPVQEQPTQGNQVGQPRVVSPSKQQGLDPPASSPEAKMKNDAQDASGEVLDGDDTLLDLDQLEELHDEAERMKALGNKHMAAQVRIEI